VASSQAVIDLVFSSNFLIYYLFLLFLSLIGYNTLIGISLSSAQILKRHDSTIVSSSVRAKI